MQFLATLLLLFAGLCGGAVDARAQEAESVTQAQQTASQWLALTDAGSYEASWEQAATLFKTAINRPGWDGAMRSVRAPLGAMKSRVLKSAQFTRSLPGAPAGEYVLLQFETVFEHRGRALETVTPMKDADGAWRVSGYYIQ